MEGLIFGGAYLRREICVSKSIGLACSGKEIYHFCFVLLLYSRANSKYKPPRGAYIWRGDLTEGFLRYDFGGLIILFGGLIFGILRYCSLSSRSDQFLPTFRSLYVALVRSHLEYASEIWSPKSVTLIKFIEGVQ